MSCFLFSVSILCVELLRVIVRVKFSPGLNFLEDKSVGGGYQYWKQNLKQLNDSWSGPLPPNSMTYLAKIKYKKTNFFN